mmetsp:Transcript_65082/g.108125  ORF Transcript_65082/g.108125 Transcript_65082/m.108125 type:complete len:270 (-) Transcript_65082:248-1057(-)
MFRVSFTNLVVRAAIAAGSQSPIIQSPLTQIHKSMFHAQQRNWNGAPVASPVHMLHPHTDIGHRIWRETLHSGDMVVDATAGNGHDTLVLTKALAAAGGGTLWACDIQAAALSATRQRLRNELAENWLFDNESEWKWSLQDRSSRAIVTVCWRHGCHVKLLESFPDVSVRLIVFNLGYLPGGDKTLVTTASSTVRALKEAERAICAGGTVSATIYPGHDEGLREEEDVLEHAAQLKQEEWSVYHHIWLNQRNKRNGRRAPSLLLVQRLH